MELVGQAIAHLDIRPQRAAYLVPAGSGDAVRQAIASASRRWGGIAEPIIPVSSRGRIAENWLRTLQLLRAHVLVNVGLTDLARSGAERRIGNASVPLDKLRGPAEGAHPLLVRPAPPSGTVVLPPDGSLLQLAAAGTIPLDEVADWSQLGVGVYRARTDDECARAQLHGTTVLAVTATALGELQARNMFPGPAVVWVARANAVRDAVEFWNARALSPRRLHRAPILLIPPNIEPWVNFAEHFASFLVVNPRNEPDVVITGRSVPRQRLEAVRDLLQLHPHTGQRLRSTRRSIADRESPATAAIGLDPFHWLLFKRAVGARSSSLVQVVRPTTTVRIASPINFDERVGGFIRAEISGPEQLNVPRRRAVAQLFLNDAEWGPSGVEVCTVPRPLYDLTLRIPSPGEILGASLKPGVTVQLSDKGRYAEAVARLAGGTEVFLEPGVIDVITALTTPRRSSLLRELRAAGRASVDDATLAELADEWGRKAQQSISTLPQISQVVGSNPTVIGRILNVLVPNGVVARGFLIGCDTCLIRTFAALPDVTRRPECPACGAQAEYRSNGREPTLHYRLNALVDRANDNGALVHLAAQAALERRGPQSFFLPGADVRISDRVRGEIDVVGTMGHDIIAGEVKTSPSAFTRKQLYRDIELTAAIGADVHVVAAIGPLDESKRSLIEHLTERHGLSDLILDLSAVQM